MCVCVCVCVCVYTHICIQHQLLVTTREISILTLAVVGFYHLVRVDVLMASNEDNGGCASCQFLEHILSGRERVAQPPICHFCPWKQELINDSNFQSTKAHAYLCPLAQFQVVLCCARLLSCVRLFATPQTVAYQAPLGILQARILKWVAVPSSRESSQPRDRTQVSSIVGGFFTFWATREA